MDELTVLAADGVPLHVSCTGEGPEVVVLSGGPGCVHYLADEGIAPAGVRSWFPDPRGVGRSGGALTTWGGRWRILRTSGGRSGWTAGVVLGHSWGCDLAVRYALDHPGQVAAVVGIAGHGLHKDRSWSAIYEELVPAGSFESIAGVDHNFWTTDPERWIKVVTEACTQW